jgi:Carbohydrate esterase, sialic acid-specific acetylesterase
MWRFTGSLRSRLWFTACFPLAVLCVCLACSVACAENNSGPDPARLDIWVFAGQSNSQGWALLKAPVAASPHIFALDENGHWNIAREPLNPDFYRWTPPPVEPNILLQRRDLPLPGGSSPEEFVEEQKKQGIPLGGVGPGLMFAERLHGVTHRDIGLILCGVGSPIREWDPDSQPAGKLYAHMLTLIRKSGGRVKGLVWYQGESDALTPGAAEHYHDALLALFDGIRRDLHQPELPILCVQTGRFVYPYRSGERSWETVREAQRRVTQERPHTYLVSSIDLTLEDDIHVGFEGYRRLTPRIAAVALSAVYGLPGHGTPITFDSAQLIAPESWRPMIRVRFRGVSGRLASEGRPSGFEIRMPGPVEDPGAHYPSTPAPDVPLYSVYRVDFDPSDPSSVILGLFDASPILLGHHHPLCGTVSVIYAPGLNPYANIHDGRDMALPAFGPVPVSLAPCAEEETPGGSGQHPG